MKTRKNIDRVLGGALVIIMSAMVLNVLWQVFTRFVIGTPSSFTDELARYLMIWVGILGAAYTAGKDMHVAIDVLPQRFSKAIQKKLSITVKILVILFALSAMVIGGSRLVYVTYVLGQLSPALQIPLAYVYLVLPISGLLVIYYKIMDILKPTT
ncbi:TRAP transporter small permease [Flagellimonas pacifica]|uniref:TRAP-type C4-dicarboxylate transport system, small permease component n=1 Tax=Flagellimonas pacifica TaxID=1247520 RepID=A0A285MSA6_9FLAO|nr:TRAP transporter small permease [Allomuricauda parva]SNZ00055.1 TRAP-type C4-dicarboxylate transport system, small permease component [Allomuricauda parva]